MSLVQGLALGCAKVFVVTADFGVRISPVPLSPETNLNFPLGKPRHNLLLLLLLRGVRVGREATKSCLTNWSNIYIMGLVFHDGREAGTKWCSGQTSCHQLGVHLRWIRWWLGLQAHRHGPWWPSSRRTIGDAVWLLYICIGPMAPPPFKWPKLEIWWSS